MLNLFFPSSDKRGQKLSISIGLQRSFPDEQLPFITWDYNPPYLPANLKIDIAKNTKTDEPLIFVIPFCKSDRFINHLNGIKNVTNIKITIPSRQPFSPALDCIANLGLINFRIGKKHLVEIECDRQIQRQAIDLRPDLPLCFYW